MTESDPTGVDPKLIEAVREAAKIAELAGIAEIAEEFGVPRTTVSMWGTRRSSNGFPEPVVQLAAGPVYDMGAVRAWHAAKYHPAVDE